VHLGLIETSVNLEFLAYTSSRDVVVRDHILTVWIFTATDINLWVLCCCVVDVELADTTVLCAA